MERWGNEMWRTFVPHPLPQSPNHVFVAIYTAVVDVDIVHAELRFNEQLHPDEILKALLADDWGSLTLQRWPPPECTERNRFRLLALRKILIFLGMAEYVESLGKPARPRPPEDEPADEARAWAYNRFPAIRAAAEAGGGPYRRCTFEARIARSGMSFHDYHIAGEGIVPPGLTSDKKTMAFVRALVQSDLRRRDEALLRRS